jgi:hypothetical protein
MTDDLQKLKNDIEFMRSLTHDSSGAVQRDGHLLIAVGLIFGLICLFYWLMFRIEFGALPNWMKWAWITGPIALIVFVAVTVAVIALTVGAWRLGLPQLVTQTFPVVLFTLYGSAWSLVFAIKLHTQQGCIALGCFAGAILCGVFMGMPEEWLVLASGLFLLVALPGALMVRQARSE